MTRNAKPWPAAREQPGHGLWRVGPNDFTIPVAGGWVFGRRGDVKPQGDAQVDARHPERPSSAA